MESARFCNFLYTQKYKNTPAKRGCHSGDNRVTFPGFSAAASGKTPQKPSPAHVIASTAGAWQSVSPGTEGADSHVGLRPPRNDVFFGSCGKSLPIGRFRLPLSPKSKISSSSPTRGAIGVWKLGVSLMGGRMLLDNGACFDIINISFGRIFA